MGWWWNSGSSVCVGIWPTILQSCGRMLRNTKLSRSPDSHVCSRQPFWRVTKHKTKLQTAACFHGTLSTLKARVRSFCSTFLFSEVHMCYFYHPHFLLGRTKPVWGVRRGILNAAVSPVVCGTVTCGKLFLALSSKSLEILNAVSAGWCCASRRAIAVANGTTAAIGPFCRLLSPKEK